MKFKIKEEQTAPRFRVKPPPEKSYADIAVDMAKSAGSGIVSGIEAGATFPMQIGNFLGEGLTGLIDRAIGVPPEETARLQEEIRQSQANGIGPASVLPRISDAIGGNYDPQTTAGEYAKTWGQFMPAIVAGPGSLAKKGIAATSSALAAEGATQGLEGTQYEQFAPYASLAAALAAPMGLSALERNPLKTMRKNAPSQADVKRKKDAIYGLLERSGVKYDANEYAKMVSEADALMQKKILDPSMHPNAAAVLAKLKEGVGTSPSFEKMDSLRQFAGEATRSSAKTEPKDIYRAGLLLGKIDDFFQGAPVMTNSAIPADKVNKAAKMARELARRNILARDINEMSRKSQYYLGGAESGARNQFASYLKSPKGKMLTPAEQQAFKSVITREGLENVTHNAGSRLANIGALLAGGSTPWTGPAGLAGAAGMVGANLAARKISEKMTDKKVRDALATALAGRAKQSAAMSKAGSLKKEQIDRLLRALLSAESARVSAPQMVNSGSGAP